MAKVLAGAAFVPVARQGAGQDVNVHIPASMRYDLKTGKATLEFYPFQKPAEPSSSGKTFVIDTEQGTIPGIETPAGHPAGQGKTFRFQVLVTVPLAKDDPMRARMMIAAANPQGARK